MKTNQLELLSKNLFADVGRINEDLKYFSADERSRVSSEILSHNTRRENRSGTVNFVPPVNKFETKLINSIPIIDTPYMIGKKESPQILDFLIQNNINEEEASSGDENNNNNNRNESRSSNTYNFTRNINIERFNIKFEGKSENKKQRKKITNNKKNKNIKNDKNDKNGKILGIKRKRNKNKENNEDNEDDKNIPKNENKIVKKKK